MLTEPRASSLKYDINNFVFQGAKLWNSLPASAKGLENPCDFKSFLEEGMAPNASVVIVYYVVSKLYKTTHRGPTAMCKNRPGDGR